MCLKDGLHQSSTCRGSAGGEYGVGLLDSRYQVPGNVGLFLLLFHPSSELDPGEGSEGSGNHVELTMTCVFANCIRQ